jgi:hypothetical protein
MRASRTLIMHLAAVIVLFSSFSFSQSTMRSSPGLPDCDVPVPTNSGVLGQKDAPALTELGHHLAVVGPGPWGGIQATGKITYAAQDATTYDATLSNLGVDRFRLDTQTKRGPMSIRIRHSFGEIQNDDGSMTFISPNTAAAGLFPFETARAADVSPEFTSLVDHGLVAVGGVELHRITFEFALTGNSTARSKPTTTTDLYFDPTSHLLVKTANSVDIPGTPRVKFLRVVTYSDYRKVGTTMIPFHYSETLDGQQYWMLQLSYVQLNPALSPTYFDF